MRPCGAQAGNVAALPGLGDGLPFDSYSGTSSWGVHLSFTLKTCYPGLCLKRKQKRKTNTKHKLNHNPQLNVFNTFL